LTYLNKLEKLPYFKQLHYYFTSRQGDDSMEGQHTIYALKFGFDDFDFEKLKSNIAGELLGNKTESNIIKPGSGKGADDLDFAVMTALFEDEHTAFDDNMNSKKLSGKNLKKGTFVPVKNFPDDYKGEVLLSWQQDMGNIDAAALASKIISENKPKFLIMGGVCGGLGGEVNLYDVIIPKQIWDYMSGKFVKGEFLPNPISAVANQQLIGHLVSRRQDIINNMLKITTSPEIKSILKGDFQVHFKDYASGPWLMKTNGALLEIAREKSVQIVGLEMESLGVIRAANLYSKYSKYGLVVKSVMDFTDENKSDGNKGGIKATAAVISYLCVRAMLPVLLEFDDPNL
jgi:nucleoside phosphorylase